MATKKRYGYKQLKNPITYEKYVAKLEILGAVRYGKIFSQSRGYKPVSRKRRCEAAKVIWIKKIKFSPHRKRFWHVRSLDMRSNVKSSNSPTSFARTRYVVGKIVKPDEFDFSYTECSNGIHFFWNVRDAINY